MTTIQWQDETDEMIISRLVAAEENANDGAIYACWDELNRRGWKDAEISQALRSF